MSLNRKYSFVFTVFVKNDIAAFIAVKAKKVAVMA